MGKKTLLTLLALLVVRTAAYGEPGFIVLPGLDRAQVKLMASSAYQSGTGISYEIRHWPDGDPLSQGEVNADRIKPDASGLNAFEITGLRPKLWSPQDPQLYEIEIKGVGKARLGFRVFETKDRKFYLNGRPIFLRAMPIDPPGRDLPDATGKDPEFMRGYLRLLKSAHVNLIRTDSQEWLDACDEIGMMTFQGGYGGIPGNVNGIPPPYEQAQSAYRDIVVNLANHPCVVIYVLTNEILYRNSPESLEFLERIRADLRLVDPTRPVIGNAGFGRGKPGEIFDVHPYWGYYSGNLCDWYRLSEYQAMADEAGQPLTLSECVGAYTSDAGTFLTMSKQLSTMVRWAGPEEDQRTAALDYQAELVRQVVEISRRMRTAKTGVAGVMPFTYFLGWANAKTAADLIIKPAFTTLKEVFQPVLISAECWHRNLYTGDSLKLRLCVANDDDQGRDLRPSTAQVRVVSSAGKVIASGQARFPAVSYYSNAWAYLTIPIPKDSPRGDYDVRMTLLEDGKAISINHFAISVAPMDWAKTRGLRVSLYDPSGKTAKALAYLGIQFTRVTSLTGLPGGGALVIGEGAPADGRYPSKSAVQAFLNRGGRILCLGQDPERWKSDWLPAQFVPKQQKPPYRQITYIHPVGGNKAIFDGLRARDLRYWNEIGRDPQGVPRIGPVIGPLIPASVSDLRNSRIWAVCDQMMRGAAIVEMFHGHGSVILSQFQCVDRARHDPFAARLLTNLVRYAASPDHPQEIDLSKPIRWDLGTFRSGVIASPSQGFLPHSKTYQHEGSSKGMLGADHRIDGMTLLGKYSHNSRGWIDPVPDPNVEGWGIVYGRLTRPAKQLVVKVRNPSDAPGAIRVIIDGKEIGKSAVVPPGADDFVTWHIDRGRGPLKLEFRGDQRLVILDSRFQ